MCYLRQLIDGCYWLNLCAARYLDNSLQDFGRSSEKCLPKRWCMTVYISGRQLQFEQLKDYSPGKLSRLRRFLGFKTLPSRLLRGSVKQRIKRSGQQCSRVIRRTRDKAAQRPLTGKLDSLVLETILLPRDGAEHRSSY